MQRINEHARRFSAEGASHLLSAVDDSTLWGYARAVCPGVKNVPVNSYSASSFLMRSNPMGPNSPREMKLGDVEVTCNQGDIASKSNVRAT